MANTLLNCLGGLQAVQCACLPAPVISWKDAQSKSRCSFFPAINAQLSVVSKPCLCLSLGNTCWGVHDTDRKADSRPMMVLCVDMRQKPTVFQLAAHLSLKKTIYIGSYGHMNSGPSDLKISFMTYATHEARSGKQALRVAGRKDMRERMPSFRSPPSACKWCTPGSARRLQS